MRPQDQIEYQILQVMVDNTPSEYRYRYYFTFVFLTRRLDLDREQIRGHLRSLRNRDFAEYDVEFNEDGETVGGGFALTPAGLQHWHSLKEQLLNERIQARDAQRRRRPCRCTRMGNRV